MAGGRGKGWGDVVEIEYLLNRFSLSFGSPGITWQHQLKH